MLVPTPRRGAKVESEGRGLREGGYVPIARTVRKEATLPSLYPLEWPYSEIKSPGRYITHPSFFMCKFLRWWVGCLSRHRDGADFIY